MERPFSGSLLAVIGGMHFGWFTRVAQIYGALFTFRSKSFLILSTQIYEKKNQWVLFCYRINFQTLSNQGKRLAYLVIF